jgi:hypothetical protein
MGCSNCNDCDSASGTPQKQRLNKFGFKRQSKGGHNNKRGLQDSECAQLDSLQMPTHYRGKMKDDADKTDFIDFWLQAIEDETAAVDYLTDNQKKHRFVPPRQLPIISFGKCGTNLAIPKKDCQSGWNRDVERVYVEKPENPDEFETFETGQDGVEAVLKSDGKLYFTRNASAFKGAPPVDGTNQPQPCVNNTNCEDGQVCMLPPDHTGPGMCVDSHGHDRRLNAPDNDPCPTCQHFPEGDECQNCMIQQGFTAPNTTSTSGGGDTCGSPINVCDGVACEISYDDVENACNTTSDNNDGNVNGTPTSGSGNTDGNVNDNQQNACDVYNYAAPETNVSTQVSNCNDEQGCQWTETPGGPFSDQGINGSCQSTNDNNNNNDNNQNACNSCLTANDNNSTLCAGPCGNTDGNVNGNQQNACDVYNNAAPGTNVSTQVSNCNDAQGCQWTETPGGPFSDQDINGSCQSTNGNTDGNGSSGAPGCNGDAPLTQQTSCANCAGLVYVPDNTGNTGICTGCDTNGTRITIGVGNYGTSAQWCASGSSGNTDGNTDGSVNIAFTGSTYTVCAGQSATVTWNGYHNICEVDETTFNNLPDSSDNCNSGQQVWGFESDSAVKTLTNLGAQSGGTRFFICSKHPTSKFKVECQAPSTGGDDGKVYCSSFVGPNTCGQEGLVDAPDTIECQSGTCDTTRCCKSIDNPCTTNGMINGGSCKCGNTAAFPQSRCVDGTHTPACNSATTADNTICMCGTFTSGSDDGASSYVQCKKKTDCDSQATPPVCSNLHRTCDNVNGASLTKTTFDCSGETNAIAAAPATITCIGSPCTPAECCTGAANQPPIVLYTNVTGTFVKANCSEIEQAYEEKECTTSCT